jgi:predicted  nucleic acid-binding Zn-ribbon protein
MLGDSLEASQNSLTLSRAEAEGLKAQLGEVKEKAQKQIEDLPNKAILALAEKQSLQENLDLAHREARALQYTPPQISAGSSADDVNALRGQIVQEQATSAGLQSKVTSLQGELATRDLELGRIKSEHQRLEAEIALLRAAPTPQIPAVTSGDEGVVATLRDRIQSLEKSLTEATNACDRQKKVTDDLRLSAQSKEQALKETIADLEKERAEGSNAPAALQKLLATRTEEREKLKDEVTALKREKDGCVNMVRDAEDDLDKLRGENWNLKGKCEDLLEVAEKLETELSETRVDLESWETWAQENGVYDQDGDDEFRRTGPKRLKRITVQLPVIGRTHRLLLSLTRRHAQLPRRNRPPEPTLPEGIPAVTLGVP